MEVTDPDVVDRARRHAALGEPARLAIVEALLQSDRAPRELAADLDLPSNLLAHHLDALEAVGLISRSRSSGDGRRRYVRLHHDRLPSLRSDGRARRADAPALFVCTANSARSQLAAALWRALTGGPARSAGTHPAPAVHPEAVAAARRAGLDLRHATPTLLDPAMLAAGVRVTVCDRAYEELAGPPAGWLHWSVPDPVGEAPEAFDAVVEDLRRRIVALVPDGARTP